MKKGKWVMGMAVFLGFASLGVAKEANAAEMYRLYNKNSGEHFYTATTAEKNNLVKVGWRYEGIGWTAPNSGNPVYRMYNKNAGDHHYTLNLSEKNMLVKAGWKYEGIGWYSDTKKAVPLYRAYNPNAKAGSHNYTVNHGEQNNLIKAGWRNEGIAWYGVKKTTPIQNYKVTVIHKGSDGKNLKTTSTIVEKGKKYTAKAGSFTDYTLKGAKEQTVTVTGNKTITFMYKKLGIDLDSYKRQAQDKINSNYSALTPEQKNAYNSRINKATTKEKIDKIVNEAAAQDVANKADKEVANAQNRVNQAQKKANGANQAVTDATKILANANQAVSDAQAKVDHIESNKIITVGSEYVNALKLYEETKSSDPNYQQIKQRLENATEAAFNNAGEYKSNQTDKSIKINRMSDLNKARRTELTVYAARLVNSIRTEFGSQNWIVSDGAIKFAGDVANNYTSDNWNSAIHNSQHYVQGINKAAAVSGLYSTATANMYENLAAGYTGVLVPNNWNLSLDDFKKMTYNGVKSFMFNGAEWDHASDLAGCSVGSRKEATYFGSSYSCVVTNDSFMGIPAMDNLHLFSVHFERVPNYGTYVQNPAAFDMNNTHPVDLTVPSQNEINQLNADLANKKARAKTAETTLANNKTAAKVANDELTVAKNQLTAAKQKQTTAHDALEKAQAEAK